MKTQNIFKKYLTIYKFHSAYGTSEGIKRVWSIFKELDLFDFTRRLNTRTIKVQFIHLLLNKSTILNRLLWIPEFRNYLVKSRFTYFQQQNKMKTINIQDSSTEHAFTHNFDTKRMFFNGLSERPDLISKPLSCEISVMQNASKMRILLIGPRTEAEIFSFRLCGFLQSNIYAIDLASYTPLIEIMNAEKLDYDDNYFDVIVLGWVMEFVSNPNRIKTEVRRCLKSDGILAIGSMYHPKSQDMYEYNLIKKHIHRIWQPQNTNEIANFFELTKTIFNSDVLMQDSDKRCDLVYIGRLEK